MPQDPIAGLSPPSGRRAPAAGAPVRLLVAGPLHLGRTPACVPPGEPTLSVDAVLAATADTALALGVDALVLTGHALDAGNRAFEGAGLLERVLRRLAEAGLPAFAVAGAEDHDALAAVADRIDSPLVRVLGRGQTWEHATLTRDGADVLRLAGWSAAGPAVAESPLATFPDDASDLPTVGVLHTDERLEVLRAAPVAAWLVGDGSEARILDGGGPLVVLPGVLQPLAPTHTGVHGPMLVTIAADGATTAEVLPLATLHYGRVDVDLAEAQTAAEARALAATVLREHAASVREASPAVLRTVVSLRLTGRTAAFASVDALAAELRADGDTAHAGLTVSIARVDVAAGPDLDLGRLAAGSGAVATLARLSARLGTDGPLDASVLTATDRALVARTADAVRVARGARVFETLAADGRLDGDVSDEAVGRLRRQVSRLLHTALAQNAGE